MTVPKPPAELSLDDVRRLVDDEQAHIDEKLTAFDRFADGVRRLPTDSPLPSGRSTRTTPTATPPHHRQSSTTCCRTVGR